ncbi:MAG: hypothetical protein R3F20_07385 [Planctomycetota bacterium]
MKRFRFPLQRLLDLEERRCEQAKLALAAAVARAHEAESRERAVRRHLDAATERYREAILAGRLETPRVFGAQAEIDRLGVRLIAAREERKELEAEVERRRAELAEVRGRESVLRNRQLEARQEWRRDAERQELDAIDEFLAGKRGRGR